MLYHIGKLSLLVLLFTAYWDLSLFTVKVIYGVKVKLGLV